MPAVLTTPVEDSKDHHDFTFNAVEQLLGKPSREDSAKAAVVNRGPKGAGFQSDRRLGHRREKLVAQPRALLLVPVARVFQVTLSGGADGEAPTHRDEALRIRLRTSRQRLPVCPSCSNAVSS